MAAALTLTAAWAPADPSELEPLPLATRPAFSPASGPAEPDDDLAFRHMPHGPHRRAEPTLPSRELRTRDDLHRPIWEWEHFTDDWLGLRPPMEKRGLTITADYSIDWLANLRGGLNSADTSVYRGLFDLTATFDTEVAGLWKGGIFLVHFQSIHGRWINQEHVGALQEMNNADAPDRTQVAEYIYAQHLFDDRLQIKLGKMDANTDFAYVDHGAEFIHSSAGHSPVVPMPTFPDPGLGAVLKVEPTPWLCLAAGVYDAAGRGDQWGFGTTFHSPAQSITLYEIRLKPVWKIAGQELNGTYRIGGWYDSRPYLVLPTQPPAEDDNPPPPPQYRRNNSGLYLAFDQMLYREPAQTTVGHNAEIPDVHEPIQGLGAFFQLAWAPSATNEISQYYGGGLQYTGLIPGRDQDTTGMALFHASLSSRSQALEARHSESAIELFHKFQLAPWLSIKPDFQYIANPGGDGRDAIVGGMRAELSF